MRRLLLILPLAFGLAACGGGGDDDAPADQTATRAADLAAIETIQAGDWTATPTGTATPPPTPTLPPGTPTAAPGPTSTAEPTATSTTAATATIEPTVTPEPQADLLSLLPTISDMPIGLAMTEEKYLTNAEVAATWDDPEAHLDRLEEWGFVTAATREFEIPNPGFNDATERTIAFTTSVTQYGSDEGARAYADLSSEEAITTEGAEILIVSAGEIGDYTIAVQGTITDEDSTAIVARLCVVEGSLVWTYTGVSLGYNPLPDLIAIAATVDERW